MYPNLHISVLAVLAAAVAGFLFGGLWYGPIAGKKWAELMGMSKEDCAGFSKAQMARCFISSFVASLLTAYVLVHSMQAWMPSSWSAPMPDGPGYVYAFFGAFFAWLGYMVPPLLTANAWEKKSWQLCVLNGAFHFLHLQIIGLVLAYFPY